MENFTPIELLKLLHGCSDPVSIEVWRQMSPFNSAGSSPIPVIHKDMCQVSGTQSSQFSKSEDMKHLLWDGNDHTMENQKSSSSHKVKTSSSQTDDLNNTGSNDRTVKGSKSEKDLDNHKSKNSHRLVEKAFGKIFKPKSKHQDRHDHDDTNKRNSTGRPTSTVNDSVLLEFNLGESNGNRGTGQRKNYQKHEFDSENSGTWPKYYKMQPMKQGTVIMPSPQKYPDRPSIASIFSKGPEKIPPVPPERTEASHIAVKQSPHHSPQSSDSTIKLSNSPIHSPPMHIKSKPYMSSSSNSNVYPNVFNPDNAMPPNHGMKHLPPKTKKRPPSSHHSHYDMPSVGPREAWEWSRGIRNRPRSSEKDRQHRPSANLSSFNSSQFHSSCDSSLSGTGLPVSSEFQNGQSVFASESSAFNTPPPFSEHGQVNRMQHNRFGYIFATNFKSKFQLVFRFEFFLFSLELLFQLNIDADTKPVLNFHCVCFSGTLVVRPHPHYSVHGSQTSAPVPVSPSFSPGYNSPPGSYPDIETRRSPYDFCNSPCPSVISSASDYSYIPSGTSSVSDIDGSAKTPYTKNKPKRINIPNVKTRVNSGSVEVGKKHLQLYYLNY